MPKFTHLHVHSHYSLLDGLGTIPNLIARAQSLGMDALALTDHGVLYGVVEFSQKAKAAGIKPIIGCELYVAPRSMTDKVNRIDTTPYHLIVLCKNQQGYHNLLQLVSQANLNGYYYKPRVDKELLRKYHEGLICLTGCLQGEVSRPAGQNDPETAEKALMEYLDIFGKDNLYIELQHHPELASQVTANKHLIDLAHKHNVPLVATNDVHYLEYGDAEAQDVLLCIQTGKFLNDTNRMSMKEDGKFLDLSMMSGEQMAKNFADVPEAISNSNKIADRCQFELKLGGFIFPVFPVPTGQEPHQYMTDLCIKGMWERMAKKNPPTGKLEYPGEIDPVYITRLEYELGIIAKAGFTSYMLMVADYTNEAKRRGIFTNTRGSAAGSLVAYLLGIIDLDPLPYGLIFERFLNLERISWPDVDLDIADVRRGELIEYVAEKYGADKVAQIITFGTIAAKNSIRDVGRVLGMPYGDVDVISKFIPLGMNLSQTLTDVEAMKDRYQQDAGVKRLIDLALKVEGIARHASVHAAGVVISDKPITDYVSVQRIKDESGVVTQFAMNELEAIGLVKMDFLGLANLTILEQALEIIEATRGINIKVAELPLDDAETYKLLARGESSGVFQLESDGMKRYLKELQPSQIGDIIAMVALYRPGPMEFIPDYIAGKHGRKKVEYLHPKLEPILKETYGIAVYQEQIIRIAMDLCAFSYGEADVLRKAIGKKKKELLLEQRQFWVKKGVENGIKKQLAEKLFDFVEPFARYGFNKAHATSYGMIAYQTAYLKTHYPSQFMAAWLTSEQSRDMEKVSFALQECERMGIEVLAPDVDESFVNFGVVKNEKHQNEKIRFGLAAIKNVGQGVAGMIVKERKKNGPFLSLNNFIERLDPKVLNRKTMESLAGAGALDRFADRNQLMFGMEQILKYAQGLHKKDDGQIDLFGSDNQSASLAPLTLPTTTSTTTDQILKWEKELLGIYLSEHPLGDLKTIIGTDTKAIGSLNQNDLNKTVRVLGIIVNSKQIMTKSNQPMVFAKIEDTTGATEVIVFPTVLAETGGFWDTDKIVVVDGKVNDKDGTLKILANAAWDITATKSLADLDLPNVHDYQTQKSTQKYQNNFSNKTEPMPKNTPVSEIHLTIPKGSDKSVLQGVKDLLDPHPGETAVVLHVPNHQAVHVIKSGFLIDLNPELIGKLSKLLGKENVSSL